MRLWRAFVALEIIEMLIYRNPELRLERLEQKFEMKMEEVAFLRVDIQRLRERVAKRQAAEEAAVEAEAAFQTEVPQKEPILTKSKQLPPEETDS